MVHGLPTIKRLNEEAERKHAVEIELVQINPPRFRHCDECNEDHELMAFCEKCGTCLYKHCTQVRNKRWPLFKCNNCGQVNFWD